MKEERGYPERWVQMLMSFDVRREGRRQKWLERKGKGGSFSNCSYGPVIGMKNKTKADFQNNV